MTNDELERYCQCGLLSYRLPVVGHFSGNAWVVTYRIGDVYVASSDYSVSTESGHINYCGRTSHPSSIEGAMASHMKFLSEILQWTKVESGRS